MSASRLLAWCDEAHYADPLASVYPPSFIIDDRGIKLLASLHLSNITGPNQVVAALGETQEWNDEYSHQVFKTIQVYNCKLIDHLKNKAAQHKAHRKHVKHEQDHAKFTKVSNEIEERIRQDVLRQHATATARDSAGEAQTRS